MSLSVGVRHKTRTLLDCPHLTRDCAVLTNKLPQHLKIPIRDCGKMLLNYPEEEYPLQLTLKIRCVRR